MAAQLAFENAKELGIGQTIVGKYKTRTEIIIL